MKKIALFFVLILILLSSCRVQKAEKVADPLLPLKKGDVGRSWRTYVDAATTGEIALRAKIAVHFLHAVPGAVTGKSAAPSLFTIDPPVRGRGMWENPRTLVLVPFDPLKPLTTYHATLALHRVSETFKDARDFPFTFSTSSNMIERVHGEFSPVHPGDPSLVKLNVTVRAIFPLDVKELEKASSIPLTWKREDDKPIYHGTSKPIKRSGKAKDYTLTLSKESLKLDRDMKRIYTLGPVRPMAVHKWKRIDESNTLGVQAIFTEPLKEGKDYTGYLQLSPSVAVKAFARGRSLVITGPFDRKRVYTLTIRAGITSSWGTKMHADARKALAFADMKPMIRFTRKGAFLSTAAEGRIIFQSVNVKKVHLEIYHVLPENVGQFLQVNDLEDKKDAFNEVNRVADRVVGETITLKAKRNVLLQNALDLGDLLEKHSRGIFLIGLSFTKSDITYDCSGHVNYGYDYNYYENPCSSGYFYQNARIEKPILVSNIGLAAQRDAEKLVVYATNILTGKPEPNVTVQLFAFNNKLEASKRTDSEGRATFGTVGSRIAALKDGQVTVMKMGSDKLDLDGFPIEGVTTLSASGLGGFVYSERDVYRPGDKVYLSCILREGGRRIPPALPLLLKVYNSKNQMVYSSGNRKGLEGMYTFTIPTHLTDPTGMWRAVLSTGKMHVATHRFRVEMVAPPRIKVKIENPDDRFAAPRRTIPFTLACDYLFGAPGSGLKFKASGVIRPKSLAFPRFKNFTFSHPGRHYEQVVSSISSDKLDEKGRCEAEISIPSTENVPSALSVILRATVFEKGGRPVQERKSLTYFPYPAYVGIKQLNSDWVTTKSAFSPRVVVVDPSGKPLVGRDLQVSLYLNSRWWWWEYRSRRSWRRRYKQDYSTRLIRTYKAKSGENPMALNLKLEEGGSYLLEVEDLKGGHVAGIFFYGSRWGEQTSEKGGNTLQVHSDKRLYNPGEKAEITIAAPQSGSLLATVVRGDKILSTRWITAKGPKTTFSIPVTKKMIPNVHLFVEAIQPLAGVDNDRPVRTYSVIPLEVESSSSRLSIKLEAPKEVKPNADFSVAIRADKRSKHPVAVTVAVVDEGLLSLTHYRTPDPWSFFYKKLGLNVSFYDIFDRVIGLQEGPIDQVFTVGGGMSRGRNNQTLPVKVRRFPPVVLFKGPILLKNGLARVAFHMPNTMGRVRVMVVGCSGDAYASADAQVFVKEDLVLLPTLPRVIGPGETFTLPVSLFATKKGIGPVTISLETNDLLHSLNGVTRKLNFDGKGEKSIAFQLKARDGVGVGRVEVTARWKKQVYTERVHLAVRPTNPVVTTVSQTPVPPGKSVVVKIPSVGMEGTRKATLNIWRIKPIPMNRRMNRLIRYPYGCVEQTTSSVFPQLALRDLLISAPSLKDKEALGHTIDQNIQAGLDRLIRFSLPDGSFSYWPGSSGKAPEWANLYAGHFLIEAARRGYYVSSILDRWLAYEKGRDAMEEKSWRVRTYRLYLLALAGKPDLPAMNLLRENYLDRFNTIDRLFLAAGYSLAGSKDIANGLIRGASFAPPSRPDREAWSYCYGSSLADRGILLTMAVLFDRIEEGSVLYDLIVNDLKSNNWYSTQSTSWGLLGLGAMVKKMKVTDSPLAGRLILEKGKEMSFSGGSYLMAFPVDDRIGKKVTIVSKSKTTFIAEVVTSGIPLEREEKAVERGMSVHIEFFDEEGRTIDPATLDQGTIFYAHLKLKTGGEIKWVALTQIFPSGWEIVNTRLIGEKPPAWAAHYASSSYVSFKDIRDDRVSWFLDRTYSYREYNFLVKLVAVTKGTFRFSPTWAEAMYDHSFHALLPHGDVRVKPAYRGKERREAQESVARPYGEK